MKKYSFIFSILLVFALNAFAFADVAGEKFMQALEKSDVQGIKRGFAAGFAVDVDLSSVAQREEVFEGMTPLMWASSTGNLAVAKFLLQNGANINAMFDPTEMTPLMFAIENGHKEMVKLLLAHQASINMMSYSGWTALKSAVTYGLCDIVQLLIDEGANVNAYLPYSVVNDTSHASALMNAVWENRLETVKILMDNNVNMHFKDKDKETALMQAERMGHTEIAEYLRNYINPKLHDNKYFSVLFQGDASTDEMLIDEVFIEKRVTGAFSAPHAHEELIVFSLKSSAGNQEQNKIVAIFDVQSAELLAKKSIKTPSLTIDLLTTKQNTNIVFANYFEEVQGKQIYNAEIFQLKDKTFVSSNILEGVQKYLKDGNFLLSVSENALLQGDFLDVFRVSYDKNMQKNIYFIKTFKWESISNSFEEVYDLRTQFWKNYRGYIRFRAVEQNWLPKEVWSVFELAIKNEEPTLGAWLKTIPSHLTQDKYTDSDNQFYKLIAKTDKEVIIGRYIYFVDKDEAEKQQEIDPYSYPKTVAHTIQCFIFDVENGYKVSWAGLSSAIEIAKEENSNSSKLSKFSANDLKKIGVFLSNFTEIGLKSFTAEDVLYGNNPNTMLYFATHHNFINNYKSRIKKCEKDCPFGQFSIDVKYVKESLKKYFNYTLMKPSSTIKFHYENNRYYFNAEKQNPVLYARADHAEETADSNVKVRGVIYNSQNKKELHGNFEALIKAHEWNDKLTWSVLKLHITQ